MMLAAFFRDAADGGSVVIPPHFDWESLVWQASREKLLPSLAQRLQRLELLNVIPAQWMDVLVQTEALNADRNQTILDEAVHAATLLNQIGIQPVALKGIAYLLSGVYSNQASRYLADIDFLIPADRITDAASQLCKNGYFDDGADQLSGLRHHYPGLHRPGLPDVELHHSVGLGVCNRLLPAAEIISGARLISFCGACFLIPAPNDLVNHLILHSQLAHPYTDRVFPPLRAIYDLTRLDAKFGSGINWPVLSKTYDQAGESATLKLHLLQAHKTLGWEIPQAASSGLRCGPILKVRLYRRIVLNRFPKLRFVDPFYLLMSLLSRRLRLAWQLMKQPKQLLQVIRRMINPQFYRNLFGV